MSTPKSSGINSRLPSSGSSAGTSSTLVRKTSGAGSTGTTGTSSTGANLTHSPTSQIKSGLKKLSVTDSSDNGGARSPGSPSPVSRPRVSSVGSGAPSSSKVGGAYSSPSGSPTSLSTSASRVSRPTASTSNMTTTPARTVITKAPVQSPTAAGMKMRPASGANGLSTLSTIGPSALSVAATSSTNPYSSTMNGLAPSPSSGGQAPSSPIASASPNARRFKTASTPTSSGTQSQQVASSPIHSISQSGAAGLRKSYDQQQQQQQNNGTTQASSAANIAPNSYHVTHPNVHAPVNTHANPPNTHLADHAAPAVGQTIFSPVYSRTASQEALHNEEERKALAAKGGYKASTTAHGEALARQQQQQQAEQEQRYREQAQAQAYAQQQAQQQAQAQAHAQALAQQQQQHTVSYTPPQVEEDEFDPFLFIKNLPPLSPAMRARRSPLPKKSLKAPPITLALDLDETLVHCSVQPIERAELTFKVAFNGLDYEVYVRTRPHMKEFLETVSQWFEIIIFTASQKVYADKLLNILDPQGTFIKYRVFRDSCVCVDGNYLKDLHILGRDLPSVAIVDNSVQAFGFQLDNGIPIESWFDDDNDRELLNLIPFLRQLKDVKDVRPLIRDTFRLSEFVASL